MKYIESLPNWNYREWQEAKQKMRDFDAGTRKENIKRCGFKKDGSHDNDKLEAYYKICCDEGLANAAKQIEDELLSRDRTYGYTEGANIIAKYKKAPQSQKLQQSLIAFKESEFDAARATEVLSNKNTPDKLIQSAMIKGGTIRVVFVYLVYAMLGKLTNVSDALRKFLETNCGYTTEVIMDQIKQILNDGVIFKKIKTTYMQAKANFTESLNEDEHLKETVEKHDTLNPKLFDGNVLKDEVREKILEIVNKFTEDLEEDGIALVIKDIVLIGSNVSYNYTKDSDLDIHIIADTSSLNCPHDLYPLLYSAYRSLFNKRFDISFYGIPVELFVEAGDVPTVSNGIYSVKDNDWVKAPDINTIPEYDRTALDASVSKWKDVAGRIISDIKTGDLEGQEAYNAIIKYVETIYELRKKGLQTTGEYGTENLTFKEIRNAGILDELKDLKNEVTAKRLSLEALQEDLDERKRYEYAQKLSKAAQTQVILQPNGYFFIHNVKEQDVEHIRISLNRLDFVEYVRCGAAGKWDFSHVHPGTLPTRYYTIEGKVLD